MTEDPLFDPWSTDEPDSSVSPRADTPEKPTRWRSAATRDRPAVPPVRVQRDRPRTSRPDPPPPSTTPLAERLRAVAVPRLETLAARLEIARHRTLLDDRLDEEAATLRFRFAPREAPFDEPRTVAGSVLEILLDAREVVARLWLDPLAEEATEERRIGADRLSQAWIEDVALDFVARTLRHG